MTPFQQLLLDQFQPSDSFDATTVAKIVFLGDADHAGYLNDEFRLAKRDAVDRDLRKLVELGQLSIAGNTFFSLPA
jgi:hypothetical protein